jgi:uncharacterized protein YbjT (DUF2867 family)
VILVTGATGNVGSRVLARLVERGTTVRALTHDPLGAMLPSDVEVAVGDLSDAGSLASGLVGVDTVFLLWPQASAKDPAPAVKAIAERARRIVYLSSLTVQDELERQAHPMSQIHADIESSIRDSGLAWTFLRAGTFASNALGWADEIWRTGTVRLPYPGAGRSPIVADDIAAVVTRALTDEGHEGKIHVLTGPAILTFDDMVRAIGRAIGRSIRSTRISPAVARQELLDHGASAELADAALGYWARLVSDPEPVTDTVRAITGIASVTFDAWAQDHADDFL